MASAAPARQSSREAKTASIRRQNSSGVPFSTGHCAKDLWVPDKAADVCSSCNDKFTLGRRRHHCRMCGNIFHSEPCATRLGITTENAKGCWVCRMCQDFYGTYCEALYSGCRFMMSSPDGNWRGVRVWVSSEGIATQVNWESASSRSKTSDLVLQQSLPLSRVAKIESVSVKSVMKDPIPYIRVKSNDDTLVLEAFSMHDYNTWLKGLCAALYVCQQEQRLENAQKQLEESAKRDK